MTRTNTSKSSMSKYFRLLFLLGFTLMNLQFVHAKDSQTNHYVDNSVLDFPKIAQGGNNVFQLITHGRSGELFINGKWLNTEGVVKFLQNRITKNVRQVNIYGCEFGKGSKGLQAVAELEQKLGVSVAASDDITGKDGDWHLEIGHSSGVLNLSSYTHNLQRNDGNDFDGDGIVNGWDIDDDNDGVLDTDEMECSRCTPGFNVSYTAYCHDIWAYQPELTITNRTGPLRITGKKSDGTQLFQGEITTNDYTVNAGWHNYDTHWVIEDLATGCTKSFTFSFAAWKANCMAQNSYVGTAKELSSLNLTTGTCNDIDTDNDGIPNRFDLDSDNDGCNDSVEASNTSRANNSVTAFNTGTDANGNGLIDRFESFATAGKINYVSTYTQFALNRLISVCVDSDGDGVPDVTDIDDDNDGVLDAVECGGLGNLIENGDFSQGNTGFTSIYQFVTGNIWNAGVGHNGISDITINRGANACPVQQTPVHNASNGNVLWSHLGSVGTIWSQRVTNLQPNTSYTFSHNMAPEGWTMYSVYLDNTELRSIVENACTVWRTYTTTFTTGPNQTSATLSLRYVSGHIDYPTIFDDFILLKTSDYKYSIDPGAGTDESYAEVAASGDPNCTLDTDGDGIPNRLDKDSDNDGCSDAYEAGVPTTNNLDIPAPYGANGFADAMETLPESGKYRGTYTYKNAMNPLVHNCPTCPTVTTAANANVNPTTCEATNGSIKICSFPAFGMVYSVSYDKNGIPEEPITNLISNSGCITLTNLGAGVYTNIRFKSAFCTEGTFPIGPITLTGLDTVKPIFINCPENITKNISTGTTAVVTYTEPDAVDNCSVPNITRTSGLASGAAFPVGATIVTYTAVDGKGNSASCSFIVTVVSGPDPCLTDNVPPTMVGCPEDIAKTTTGTTAVVTYTAPTATDLCSTPVVTRTSGLASGAAFPIGVTTVTYTAVDAKGNTDTCTFKVTVTNPNTGTIIGTLYNDDNNNGVLDPNEAPIPNATVIVCNSNNVEVARTTTNAEGEYTFTGLQAGSYIVKYPTTANGKPLTTPNNVVVPLTPGDIATNKNAGYYKPATPTTGTVTGKAFNDNNNNGIFDGTDTPIPNTTVTLCNVNNVVVATTTTDANGNYSFPNLAVGSYIVKFPITANGKPLSTPNNLVAQVTAGQTTPNKNAGYYQPTTPTTGTVTGKAFNDNNNNGIFDGTDTPIPNTTVTLCNVNNVVVATTTTDANGNYSFPNLAVGSYIVKFPITANGKPLSTPNNLVAQVTAGQTTPNKNAGYYQPTTPTTGSIGDFVFSDNNGNGINDAGDTPKSNVPVTLCNSVGQTIATTLTVNGLYSFGNLAAGTYIVKFPPVHTDGMVLTTPQQITVNLAAGQNYISADAGYKTPTTPTNGSIGDFTFNDNNGNGIFDAGDTPKSNIPVTLCNSAGQTIATKLTVNGNYSFTNLAAGTYIVKFTPVHTDGKALTTPQQITVNLAAGQNYTTADAGYKTPNTPTNGSIGDLIFNDNNGNGIYDTGDTPKSNVLVTLCNSAGQTISTTLSVNGLYSFGNLPAGTYIVKFPPTNTDGTVLTTPQQFTVNLAAGQNYTSADAGYKTPTTPTNGSIGDFTFNDNNGNGIYDAGDTPKSNIPVTLCNSAGQTIATKLTVNGNYSFTNLAAGTYIVKFTPVHTDGKALTTPQQFTVNLAAGQNYTTADAGYKTPSTPTNGSIGDLIFNDNNGNGIYDTGDTPKSNVLVTLCNSAGQTIATTLSVNGLYSFGNLAAGTYIVKFPPTNTDGTVLTTPQQFTVNLTAGQNYTTADAGYKTPTTPTNGSIGDLTFNDNNGNGIYDAGDTPKSNIPVTLCNSAGQTIATKLTVSGNYSFGNLAAGTYIVKFTPVHTDGKALTTPQQITVNLAAGQNYTTADAGYKTPTTTPTNGSIGDLTFNDNNGNGIFDTGDTPKSNILVTLCNSAGQTIATKLTVNGNYSFTNLAAGTYIVKFTPVHTDGKALTTPQQITVNLAAGQNFTSADAGYKTPTTTPACSIGDLVFADNNNNGVYDNGDTPIAGVTVTLCNASNVVISSTTTNAAGNYSFVNLPVGTYIVKFPQTLADGKKITTQQQITVNLTAGQNYTSADAGYFKPTSNGTSSIKDVFVYCDNNNNQVYDGGDNPIEGVTVSLCNANNQVIATATTDASGTYSFLNLAAGTYIVKFPATLTDGKKVTTSNPITITLGDGETSSASDAAYSKPTNVDCNETRTNTITKACTNNIPVLIGSALPGYEYMWLSSTSACPTTSAQAIAGATQQNYSLPSQVSQKTYFMRCARPIGCTTWGATTESNCLTINPTDCTTNAVTCDDINIKGNTDGTISVTNIGNYTSYIQVINSQLQTVSNLEYNQSDVSIPVKNGTYRVNVLRYNVSNGSWVILCEKSVPVTVSGGLNALTKNILLDINAFAEAQRAQIQWINNTGSFNDFFTVEKLNNLSGDFEKIETVNSKPTEANEVYSVYDNAITEGDNTYRVQLTMFDGQVKTSALKTLKYKNLNDIRIYPNPASDFIDVDLKQYEGKKVTLNIYNQVGKLVQTRQIERATATPVHIDMDSQTSGQMLLRVTAEGHREVTKKFVIHN